MQQEEKYSITSVKPTYANHQAIASHLVFLLSGGTFLRTLNRRQFHLCLYQPSTVTKQKCDVKYQQQQPQSLFSFILKLCVFGPRIAGGPLIAYAYN